MNYQTKYLKYKYKYLKLQNKNQIGGTYIKKIYPVNIPNFSKISTYDEYFTNFKLYINTNKHKLYNLKMLIGSSSEQTDYNRFKEEYDIAITAEEDFPKWDSLLLLQINSDLYDLLAGVLSNKFDKIIYDRAVTQNISNDDLKSNLLILQNLLQENGKLYIIIHNISIKKTYLLKYHDKNYHIYDKEEKLKDLSIFNNYTYRLSYNISFGGCSIDNIILNKTENIFTEEDIEKAKSDKRDYQKEKLIEQSQIFLQKIFKNDDFDVKYIINDFINTYPNNPMRRENIPEQYFVITKKPKIEYNLYDILYVCNKTDLYNLIEQDKIIEKFFKEYLSKIENFKINLEVFTTLEMLNITTEHKYNIIFIYDCDIINKNTNEILKYIDDLSIYLYPTGLIYTNSISSIIFKELKEKLKEKSYKIIFESD